MSLKRTNRSWKSGHKQQWPEEAGLAGRGAAGSLCAVEGWLCRGARVCGVNVRADYGKTRPSTGRCALFSVYLLPEANLDKSNKLNCSLRKNV